MIIVIRFGMDYWPKIIIRLIRLMFILRCVKFSFTTTKELLRDTVISLDIVLKKNYIVNEKKIPEQKQHLWDNLETVQVKKTKNSNF